MSFLKNFFVKIAGKRVAKALDLKEGNVDNKKWYQSKTVLAGIVTVLIAVYNAVGASLAPVVGWNLPPIPDWVFTLLGAVGVYGRVTADTKIG